MPTYDYQCEGCSCIIEQIHGINEQPAKTKCLVCGKILIKLISSPSFVLKGKGWADTGYSKESPKEPTKESPSDGKKP